MDAYQTLKSAREQTMIEYFQKYIRYEGENSIFVTAEENDYILDTDIVFVHPNIPPEQLSNVRFRFDFDSYLDGVVLCVVIDKHRDVPVDCCAVTAQRIFWWDLNQKQRYELSLTELDMAYPQKTFPKRGLKLIQRKTRAEFFIQMYVHDAILDALASFLCQAQQVLSSTLIDLNNDPPEKLKALPLIGGAKLQVFLEEREARKGFKSYEEIRELLRLHHNELAAIKLESLLMPYRQSPKIQGRRVDF